MIRNITELTQRFTKASSRSCVHAELERHLRAMGMSGFHIGVFGEKRECLYFFDETPMASDLCEQIHDLLYKSRSEMLKLLGEKKSFWSWHLPMDQRDFSADCLLALQLLQTRAGVTCPLVSEAGIHGSLTAFSKSPEPVSPDAAKDVALLSSLAMLRGLSLPDSPISLRAAIPAAAENIRSLSAQQRKLLAWMAEGKTNREISIIEGMNHRTVDYHVREILRKLDVYSRSQAVAIFSADAEVFKPY